MGRTKSKPRPLKKHKKFLGLPSFKQRLERNNIYKLCVTKLARIDDPQAKLCKAVLINNTLKKLEKQPDCYYNNNQEEEDESTWESDISPSESDQSEQIAPCLEAAALCNHSLLQSSSLLNLANPDQRVPSQDVDTMSLCDDIINEFLGVSEDNCDNVKSSQSDCEQDKENLQKDDIREMGGKPVSQYSYSSFLSEVYSQTLRRIKYRVEL